MASWAVVEDGKIVESTSQSSLKKASDASKNGMDKDAFLQLLVAQMKYQDPLEPTSNTEYISQYAQFSQVEQMQNMAATTELARASSMVGKEVYIKTVDTTGAVRTVTGKVDYVVFENNKAFLAIDEKLYALEDLETIVDKEYNDAFNKAYDFSISLNKLPGLYSIDLTNADAIDKLEEIYNGMTDYEKSFLAKETVETLQKYIERLKQIRLSAGITGDEDDKVEGPGDGEEDEDKVDGSGDGEEGEDKVEGSGDGEENTEGTDTAGGTE